MKLAAVAVLTVLGLSACVVVASPPRTPSGADEPITVSVPAVVEAQLRAGATVMMDTTNRSGAPVRVRPARPDRVTLRIFDDSGKLVAERPPEKISANSSFHTGPVLLSPGDSAHFEARLLDRCDPLHPGRYRAEIRIDDPMEPGVIPLRVTRSFALTIRGDAPVREHALTMRFSATVHDDFRVPSFGVPLTIQNIGCHQETIPVIDPEFVSMTVVGPDGRSVPCEPPRPGETRPLSIKPGEEWSMVYPVSGRCQVPLPSGLSPVTYTVTIKFDSGGPPRPLQINNMSWTARLTLVNRPHSSGDRKEIETGVASAGRQDLVSLDPEEESWATFKDGKESLKKSRYCEARASFARCLDLVPDRVECHLGLASTLARLRRVAEGAEHYRAFLRLAPDHERAAEVQAILKDYDDVIRQLKTPGLPGPQGAGCRPRSPQGAAPGADEPWDSDVGGPPKREIVQVVEGAQGGFQHCIEQERRRNPGFPGARVKLVATVDVSGMVRKVMIDQEDIDRSDLGDCLKATASLMSFYAFDGDAVDIEIPLILTPT